ncbi:MAG: nuclear transport factor 2 family protein [Thaumarchaeota archaeon]|nr:nuclear transport factor 2 family protein [Candidatus Calditenuaceae archaeon]MDW8042447.1 nuclear transport factor 2 family protein [Nitrososphaerota archaeon]
MSRTPPNTPIEVIISAYESIKNGEVEVLSEFYAEGYTLISELNPGHLLEPEGALLTRRSMVGQITDLDYSLEEISSRLIGEGVALVVYRLRYRGMLVYQYRFEGRFIQVEAICTAVLVNDGRGWKILHEHLTPLS